MPDEPLFLASVDRIHISLMYEHHDGWMLRVNHRREGGTWAETEPACYPDLHSSEILDLVEAVVAKLLGPAEMEWDPAPY